MKLDVPFIINPGNDCGPVSLQMALAYLDEEHPLGELQSLIEPDASGNTWTIGIARAAASLGIPTTFCSTKLGFNPKNFEHEFVQKVADASSVVETKITRLVQEAKQHGAILQERHVPLVELLAQVNENAIPIILLDWGVVAGKSSYHGHIVPVVGYDDESIYVHDAGPHFPTPFFAIPRDVFEKARMASGTDEDIVFLKNPRCI